MATYLLAEGGNGYRAILSLAEIDTGFQDSEIIVADKMDGQPMSATLGPLSSWCLTIRDRLAWS